MRCVGIVVAAVMLGLVTVQAAGARPLHHADIHDNHDDVRAKTTQGITETDSTTVNSQVTDSIT